MSKIMRSWKNKQKKRLEKVKLDPKARIARITELKRSLKAYKTAFRGFQTEVENLKAALFRKGMEMSGVANTIADIQEELADLQKYEKEHSDDSAQ